MAPEALLSARRRSPAGSADRAAGDVLRRSDAAGFAAALDFDDSFAGPQAPVQRSRTITLTRTGAAEVREEPTPRVTATHVPVRRERPRRGVALIVDAPDRIALMAVALGVLLVIIAAATSATP